MPKTNTKGGKKKKRGKNGLVEHKTRKIILKTPGQVYGKITKIIGGGKFNVQCFDEKLNSIDRICLVRGSMRKKIWLNVDDIILVALRDYGNIHDIINKYNNEDILILKETECIPSSIFDINAKEVEFLENEKEDEDVNKEYIDYNELLGPNESENSDVSDDN